LIAVLGITVVGIAALAVRTQASLQVGRAPRTSARLLSPPLIGAWFVVCAALGVVVASMGVGGTPSSPVAAAVASAVAAILLATLDRHLARQDHE
jgi:hypothetical protein